MIKMHKKYKLAVIDKTDGMQGMYTKSAHPGM